MRFTHQNTKPYTAASALQPENSSFLDVNMVQPLLDLVDRTSVEAKFDIGKAYVAKFNVDEMTKPTTTNSFLNIAKHLGRFLLYILHRN